MDKAGADRLTGQRMRDGPGTDPPEVAGIENMVGVFINTLPLRVQLPRLLIGI